MDEPTEQERARVIAEEEAVAERQRARALRWEKDDRRRTR